MRSPRLASFRSLTFTLLALATGVVLAAENAPAKFKPVRIKTGVTAKLTDETGVVWEPDTGFKDGETIDRDAAMPIQNTKTPSLYRSERYSMTAFSYPVPNGKYVVKLHFAETFDGVSGPKGRVFSFNVEGKEFKDFDVFVKSGGFARAYIETVNVEVKDGKLDITFTPGIENPEINALEILPAP
jgi:endoglucanase